MPFLIKIRFSLRGVIPVMLFQLISKNIILSASRLQTPQTFLYCNVKRNIFFFVIRAGSQNSTHL